MKIKQDNQETETHRFHHVGIEFVIKKYIYVSNMYLQIII